MITRMLVFGIVSLISIPCLGGRPVRDYIRELDFYIAIDGKYAFWSDAGVYSSSVTNYDLLKSTLDSMKFKRAQTSPYSDALHDSVHMQGKVMFAFGGLPAIHLQSLRMNYTPLPNHKVFVEGHSPDWKLHPADVSTITSHLKSVNTDTTYDSFSVFVDGEEAFKGALYDQPKQTDIVDLLSRARLEISDNAPYPRGIRRDLPLKGAIELSIGDLPAVQLPELQLVFDYRNAWVVESENPEWTIHPDDAAMIIARYEPIVRKIEIEKQAESNPLVSSLTRIALILGGVLLTFCVMYWMRQRRPYGLRSSAPKPSWIDE